MLGTIQNNRVLVACGEGFPSEVIDWLSPYTDKFDELANYAELIDHEFRISTSYDFLEAIGLKHDWQDFEMTCCRSNFFMTWMPIGMEETVIAQAKKILQALENELCSFDKTILFDRIATDQLNLQRLEEKLAKAEKSHRHELSRIETKLKDSEKYQEKIFENHAKVIRNLNQIHNKPVVAGPVLMVDHYAIVATRFGGQDLSGSNEFYQGILEHLKELNPEKVIEANVDIRYVPSFHCPRGIEFKATRPTDWEDVWIMKNRMFRAKYPSDTFKA